MNRKPLILIVEDDERLMQVLAKHLRENDFEVAMAYDGQSAVRLFQQSNFDLVITDVMLPRLSGIEVSRAIRQMSSTVPILMLTALGTTDDKLEGFDAGADDYLVKPFEIRELVARINALIKRSRAHVGVSEVLKYADLEMNVRTKKVTRANKPLQLTPKEFNLLEYMLRNPERVLSRSEIAEKVWNTRFDTGTNFIDVYIAYLRKKVDRDFDLKLIHTRPGVGFILATKP
ncbi:DNA-binding response regulator [Thermaurantimonas aggregans]|uniref:DNA-binding response regulator n=1 Tax=Thermaurantimonas aggregans TaxID=2173829 RepID=A0A401XKX5_9FLAO|nr:response regulator transcription factor [Thermaurantimonas aggregans]MCX8148216.1 response regulator transcription factor [Thermaurantimonas aggregans]GCD77644.1 DNA-binding response regulator [Thermaurantimonas aggregans]